MKSIYEGFGWYLGLPVEWRMKTKEMPNGKVNWLLQIINKGQTIKADIYASKRAADNYVRLHVTEMRYEDFKNY